MLGILELSGVTESRVQCVHSSRVGFGKLQPVAPVRPTLCFCSFTGHSQFVHISSVAAFAPRGQN